MTATPPPPLPIAPAAESTGAAVAMASSSVAPAGAAVPRLRRAGAAAGVPQYGWRAILVFAAAVALLRIVYLALGSPYSLIEDEAHYWEWARRLDWSYYTKGPGIALAIRGAVEVIGNSEIAVRLPAVIASLLATILVAALAADVSRRPGEHPNLRIGFFAAACFQLAPMNQLVAFVSTIDGPLLACWAGACWAAWRALERGSGTAWVGVGAAIGAGFLFKYTILLLIPGIVIYWVLRRWAAGGAGAAESEEAMTISPRWRWWILAGSLAAAAGLAPVVIWNAQHGWPPPTLEHLFGHLGIAAGDMPVEESAGAGAVNRWTPGWTFGFIAMQFGLVGPALILAVAGAIWGVWSWLEAAARLRESRIGPRAIRHVPAQLDGELFLVCCAAPVLIFYLLITFIAEAEGNWAMGAYVTLLPLAGWYAADAMQEYAAKLAAWRRFPARAHIAEGAALPAARPWSGYIRRKPETPGQMLWHAAIVYGLIAGVAMLRIDWVRDGAAQLDALAARAGVTTNMAAAIPVGRFIGAEAMGRHAGEILDQLRDQAGGEPFIIARHYGRASHLAFYTPGRPAVYCASARMGAGRRTQYDFWPDTNLDDPALLGRPALLVGHDEPDGRGWERAFGQVHPIGTLRGDGKRRSRPAFIGLEYQGMPALQRVRGDEPDDRTSAAAGEAQQ